MRTDQTPSEVCARVLTALTPVIEDFGPDIVLVQGDTSTALAGALAAFHLQVPVGHVEAGLRSGNPSSPFPEEMNRRLISRLASLHFAATEHNRRTLIAEAVSERSIFVTGNPVVDALKLILETERISGPLDEILDATDGSRRIVVTSHRRESLGEVMRGNLEVLRRFAETADNVSIIFPVHPNPSVVRSAREVLAGCDRVHLVDPLPYADFIHLLAHAWLIVSDSGGVQEEAPTLGKPVLVIRENTERPEAVQCGVARLVGGQPATLDDMLQTLDADPSWIASVASTANPFGIGDSARRIVDVIDAILGPARSQSQQLSGVSAT
jgi:UDP-N-acetylglucosamine 2-epimerase (non-hydrolysing)